MIPFCRSFNCYSRRATNAVSIGRVLIGSENPIAVQSMTNTDTNDTVACVNQIAQIHCAGADIVRLTAQGKREGENLNNIVQALKQQGLEDVALVADIHFTPDIAMIAAQYVDKVRINPGNYRDADGQLLLELLERCKERGVALRIGVNHGSLAERVVDSWGDTPKGMVVSAMEFLRVCKRENFSQVVVSMKSSNVRVMVQAYRLLVESMDAENMNYPLHLGVTEAGDGEQGRIKSAVGIGTLLSDGIGDTIRVSLTEPPENEIPVAKALVDYFAGREAHEMIEPLINPELYHWADYQKRDSVIVGRLGATNVPLLYSELNEQELEAVATGQIVLMESLNLNPTADWRARILNMSAKGDNRPVILHRKYSETSLATLQLKAAADFGSLFIDGLADGIYIENNDLTIAQAQIDSLALAILQASRVRMSHTEYIACPGCGRTLYDLQKTLSVIRSRTSHLKGLKIGVMGCIVNGPGEMADADYGYVGSGKGLITLYKGREVVRRNISQDQALDALIELIKDNGDWIENNG